MKIVFYRSEATSLLIFLSVRFHSCVRLRSCRCKRPIRHTISSLSSAPFAPWSTWFLQLMHTLIKTISWYFACLFLVHLYFSFSVLNIYHHHSIYFSYEKTITETITQVKSEINRSHSFSLSLSLSLSHTHTLSLSLYLNLIYLFFEILKKYLTSITLYTFLFLSNNVQNF